MVMNVYGHTFDANRKHVADLMESKFFDTGTAKSDNRKTDQIAALLREKPELADLLLALADKAR